MLYQGDTIGSCIVQAPLGVGGMAVVVRGWDPTMGRPVAIKTIKPELAGRPSVQAHFEHGAAVLASLQHTHIVRTYDIVIDTRSSPPTLAMVMELVDGLSLEDALQRELAPPWNLFEAMAVMSPVLSAMAYAHRVGVVHRDLKPANILLGRGPGVDWPGVPKVIDFDLVKLTNHVVGADAKAGTRMGTVPYMAPEQYFGSPDLDARADVFALGVIMRQLLTGMFPVDNPNDEAQVKAYYRGDLRPPPLQALAPQLPHAARDAIQAALCIDPRHRPATAAEFLALLGSQWGSSPPVHDPSLPPPPEPQIPHQPTPAPTMPQHSDPADLDHPQATTLAHPTALWAGLIGGGVIGFFLLVLALVSC